MSEHAEAPQERPSTKKDLTRREWNRVVYDRTTRQGIPTGHGALVAELSEADLEAVRDYRRGPRLPDHRARKAELADGAHHGPAVPLGGGRGPSGPVRLAETLERGEAREIMAMAEAFDPFGPEADDELHPLRPQTRELARLAGVSPSQWVRARAEELAAREVAERVEAAAKARAVAEDHGGNPRRYLQGGTDDPHTKAQAHSMGMLYREAASWVELSGALRDDEHAPADAATMAKWKADEERSHDLARAAGERRVRLESETAASLQAARASVAALSEELARNRDDRQRAPGINSRLQREQEIEQRLASELGAIRAGGRALTELLEGLPEKRRALRRDFEPVRDDGNRSG